MRYWTWRPPGGSQGVNVENGKDGRNIGKERDCQKIIMMFPSLSERGWSGKRKVPSSCRMRREREREREGGGWW